MGTGAGASTCTYQRGFISSKVTVLTVAHLPCLGWALGADQYAMRPLLPSLVVLCFPKGPL